MKRSPAKRARTSEAQGSLPDLSAAKVEPKTRRRAEAAVAPKRQRAVWSGVKGKNRVSQLQLHLPGMGGIIQ